MFLPLIMLPFAGGSMIIRTKNRKLIDFKIKLDDLISIPLFMIMGVLIIVIEICSISVAGFLFFLCVLALFVQRKIYFDRFTSELLIAAISFLCFGFIVANFIASTSLLIQL